RLAEPLQAGKEVMDALGSRQLQAVGSEGEQLSPVHAKHLDAAKRPPEALLLEAVEGQRHQAGAVRLALVDAAVAAAEQPEAGLRVLGDDLLVPAADLVQRCTA